MDLVFRALADPTRRLVLDRLRGRNGQTLKELCADLGMTRQAVSKHVGVLEAANLVSAVRHGREKRHYLNPVPIQQIHERWTGKYERDRLRTLTALKTTLEDTTMTEPAPDFVYTIYITTTPEELWRALTDPEFTRQWWGAGDTAIAVESSWEAGAPVTHRFAGKQAPFMRGEVLEYEPPRRLAYSVGFVPTPEDPAPDPRRATARFELEPAGDTVKLTVRSTDPREDLREQVNEGWVQVVSSLKSFLERLGAPAAGGTR